MPKKRNPKYLEYGTRLKSTREALGFPTLRGFAEAMECHEDTYRAWEKGDNGVPPEAVDIMFEHWAITHDWIYRGDPSRLPFDLIQKLGLASAAPRARPGRKTGTHG